MQLSECVGKTIVAMIPFIDQSFQIVTVCGVEVGGVWIQSQSLTNKMLGSLQEASLSITPVFFVPYGQIVFLASHVPQTALNERAFGV